VARSRCEKPRPRYGSPELSVPSVKEGEDEEPPFADFADFSVDARAEEKGEEEREEAEEEDEEDEEDEEEERYRPWRLRLAKFRRSRLTSSFSAAESDCSRSFWFSSAVLLSVVFFTSSWTQPLPLGMKRQIWERRRSLTPAPGWKVSFHCLVDSVSTRWRYSSYSSSTSFLAFSAASAAVEGEEEEDEEEEEEDEEGEETKEELALAAAAAASSRVLFLIFSIASVASSSVFQILR